MQKVKAHLERTPRPLKDLRRDVPSELLKIVERMLAKDPAERYQTPVEVAAALTPFLAAPPQPPRRKHWPMVAAGFAFLAALAAGILIYVQTDNGTIVIETKDENIAVMIEKAGGVKIVDQTNKREYHLRVGAKDIPTGNYEIEVSEPLAGLEFQVRQFELKRGKEVRLVAKMLPKGKGNAPERALTAGERQRALERLNLLKEILAAKEDNYRQGSMPINEVIKAKQNVARAELILCETDRERVRVHERLVELAKQLVDIHNSQAELGQIPAADILSAKAEYQEARGDLERVQARVASGMAEELVPIEVHKTENPEKAYAVVVGGEAHYRGKAAFYWIDQFRDVDLKNRIEAAQAMGYIAQKNPEQIPVLIALLAQKNPNVAESAAVALGNVGPAAKSALSALIDQLGSYLKTDAKSDVDVSVGTKGRDPKRSPVAVKGFFRKTSLPFVLRAGTHENRAGNHR